MNVDDQLTQLIRMLESCQELSRQGFWLRFLRQVTSTLDLRPPDESEDRALVMERCWRNSGGPAAFRDVVRTSTSFGFPVGDPKVKALLRFLNGVVNNDELLADLDRLGGPAGIGLPQLTQAVYLRTVGQSDSLASWTFREYAAATLGADQGNVQRLFEFLLRLAVQMEEQGHAYQYDQWRKDADTLRDWCLRTADNYDIAAFSELERRIAAEPPIERRILVRLHEDDADDDPDSGLMDIWDYWDVPGGGDPGDEELRYGGRLVTEMKISLANHQRLGEIVDEKAGLSAGAAKGKVVVEVMLRPDLISSEVENWGTTRPDMTLGMLVPVVTRRLAEDADEDARRKRQRRWTTFFATPPTAPVYSIRNDGDAGYLNGDYLCVALQYKARDAAVVRLLAEAWAGGVSGGIWLRNGIDAAALHNATLPHQLPSVVFEARSGVDAQRVLLVWDNPYWVPEGEVLRWIRT